MKRLSISLFRLALLLSIAAPFSHAAPSGWDFSGAMVGAADALSVGIAGTFKPIGDTIWASLTVIMLICYGVKIQYATDEMDGRAAMHDLKRFGVRWMVVSLCMFCYDVPVFGYSIHQVIPAAGAFLTSKISLAIVDTALASIQSTVTGMGSPSLFAPTEWLVYLLVMLLGLVLEFVLILLSAFGTVALDIGVLFGPLLIPWLLVPQYAHWFYGWISYMTKFAMFSVVAGAQAYIWATVTFNYITLVIGGDYTFPHLLKCTLGLGIVTLGSVLGFFSTPAIVNDLFGGTAHAGGNMGMVAILKGLF